MLKELPRVKIPSAERIESALEETKDLPRIKAGDIKTEADKNIVPFENNFYLLFLAIRDRDKEADPDNPLVKTFLKDAEAFGKPWEKFLKENADLIKEIESALADWEAYDKLQKIALDFYRARDLESAQKFEDRIDPELGLKAIQIPIWQKLNTLLKKAADGMEKVGIDSKKFY